MKSNEYFNGFLSLAFFDAIIMLLLSITSAGKNILYTMYSEYDFNTLASLQYVCNYLFGPLMLLIVDKIIESVSFKKIFLISSFNLNIFLVGGLIVAGCQTDCSVALVETITVITSLIAGVLQTVFYVSFVAYINYMCNDQNRELFYGMSFSFTSMSNILANIFGYYLKQNFDLFYYYLVIVIISIILQSLFFFMKDDRIIEKVEGRPFLQEIKYQSIELYNQITYKKYALFLGVLIFAGLMNSVIYLFVPLLVKRNGYTDDELYDKTFIAFLVTGVGQVIGGISAGKLSEIINEMRVLYASLFITCLGISFTQVGNIDQNFIYILVGCFLIGYADSSISSLALIVVTKQISTKNHAFAGYNLCQSLGFGLSSIWWACFNEQPLIYDISYLYVTTVLCLASFLIYHINYTNEKQQLSEEGRSLEQMKNNLSNMLRELQIYNSPDNVFQPDYVTLMSIYEKFCDTINCDENLQLDNGPMSLFYRCKLMCRTAGIPDFQMMDIIDPDQKRMRSILAQLCKYAQWQKEIANKWEKRNKEIIQLEEVEIIEAKKQKAQLEDMISVKYRDLEMKRRRFEQVKLMKAKIELELQSKKAVKQKILQSVTQIKNELLEADKKYYNLQEKLKVAQNEMNLLEMMVVRDPKLLEQKVVDSKRRVDTMQKEVEKCHKEIQLEEFKTEKIYTYLLMDLENFARKLKIIQDSQTQTNELKKLYERLNEQFINAGKSVLIEEAELNQLLAEKESLLQQKANQEQKDKNTNQYSLQNLIDMQNQLNDIQIQVKQEQLNYSNIQAQKQDYQRQLLEQEKVKETIEGNLKSVVTQQVQEVSQYTQNIENLINNIDFE